MVDKTEYDQAIGNEDLGTLALKNESSTIDGIVDENWYLKVDKFRWNKQYPYQLAVLRAVGEDDTTYQIEAGWTYTFPLPPESIEYSMPAGITGEPTQGGYVEEHNSFPLRYISLRGSTGFLPQRGAGVSPSSSETAYIFGGTVEALRQAQTNLSNALRTASGSPVTSTNVHLESEFNGDSDASKFLTNTTGYNQIHRLKKFLEAYGKVKKSVIGKPLRLAFCNWKDNSVYLVTPMSFSINRSVPSAMEYPYQISFKAWKRVQIGSNDLRFRIIDPVRNDPSKLANMITTLDNARAAVQSVASLPKAVIGDLDRLLFEPLRESSLFCKDALGAAASIADFPNDLINSVRDSVMELMSSSDGIVLAAIEVNDAAKRSKNAIKNLGSSLKHLPKGNRTRQRNINNSRVEDIFANPKKHFETLSTLNMNDLKLDPVVRRKVEQETQRVRNLKRKDFEDRKKSIERSYLQIQAAVGASSSTVNELFGINITPIKSEPSDSDWEAIYALNDVMNVIDSLAATADNSPTQFETSLEAMAGLYRRNGLAFQEPRSKFSVPFPYGATLESLAKTYLGDPDRWYEIAALNGLKSPYIDEVGSSTPIIGSGVENKVIVGDGIDFYLGQRVGIYSNTRNRDYRRIISIEPNGSNQILGFDGDPDLNRFKASEGGVVEFFKPDTINSQQLIFIPSDEDPAHNEFLTKSIPGIDEFDPLVISGGVDLLLDSNNDLIVTPEGDTKWAIGLQNIVQQLRIAIEVPLGSLLDFPNFGLAIRPGQNHSEFSAQEIADAISRLIGQDPTFDGVKSIFVDKKGSYTEIKAVPVVRGIQQPIPIGYRIKSK